jgi:predicted membrane channel-forming protein YqfA (hemolysin III family)
MANKTSQHILGTSANLLGFCLFIITSLHLTNKTENTLIDEFTSIVALFLTISCVFSFVSIRTENEKREYKLEKIADYLFIISLIGIFGIIAFIIINFWQK